MNTWKKLSEELPDYGKPVWVAAYWTAWCKNVDCRAEGPRRKSREEALEAFCEVKNA